MRTRFTLSGNRWSAFIFAAAILLYAAPVAAQVTPALSFKLDPAVIQVGRTRDVKITPEPSTDLTGFTVQAPPTNAGVSLEEVDKTLVRLTADKGALLVRLKVDQDADPQVLNIVIKGKPVGGATASYAAALEITEFTPRPMTRQPVPPNLDPEQAVDAQFQPLSYEATKDVFGRKVADTYYAVAVGLGNNTGFDLQITKLGFITNISINVPDVDDKGRPICKNKQATCDDNELLMHKEFLEVAAIDSTMVRGSIEKEQNFGRRALALNLVGGVGTLTTGFLPFFKALGPRANFASFSSILNGQFKEGFGLAVPDLTIRHLNRLENSLVMDEEFILTNNSEKNTVIFVPRSALHPVKYNEAGKRANRDKVGWDDLIEIRRKLGRLVIVGRPVERYANREIVSQNWRSRCDGQPRSAGRRGVQSPRLVFARSDGCYYADCPGPAGAVRDRHLARQGASHGNQRGQNHRHEFHDGRERHLRWDIRRLRGRRVAHPHQSLPVRLRAGRGCAGESG